MTVARIDKHAPLEVIEAFVKQPFWAQDCPNGGYRYIVMAFPNDRKIVEKCVEYRADSFRYASHELKDDEDYVWGLLEKHGVAFIDHVSARLRADKSFVMRVYERFPSTDFIRVASKQLRDDFEVGMLAVGTNGSNLGHLSLRLRDNKEVALVALKHAGQSFYVVSDRLKGDREVFLMGVAHGSGIMLEHASGEIRRDRGLVLAAIGKSGYAIKYAAEELQSDRGLVEQAIKENGWALKSARQEFRQDKGLLLLALGNIGNEHVDSLFKGVDGEVGEFFANHDEKHIKREYAIAVLSEWLAREQKERVSSCLGADKGKGAAKIKV